MPQQPRLRSMRALDVEALRLPLEHSLLRELAQRPQLIALAATQLPEPNACRRELWQHGRQLTEAQSSALLTDARHVAHGLGLDSPLELLAAPSPYAGAALRIASPVTLVLDHALLPLLDAGTQRALLGRGFGQYLAHGPHQADSALALYTLNQLQRDEAPLQPWFDSARRLQLARQLTVDRFALLACQNPLDVLRLGCAELSALPAAAQQWNAEVQLRQALAQVQHALRDPHAELSAAALRSFALARFAESDVYRALSAQRIDAQHAPLHELNAQLEPLIGRAAAHEESAAAFEPPAPELLAGALAASVRLARCEGDLRDEARLSIERTFAALVPDCARYFDPEFATTRYHELRPVLAHLGPRQHRALFALLAHASLADGHLSAAEAQCILQIGDELRAGALFRQLLHVAAEQLRNDEAARIAKSPAPQLAPHADALEGLRTYFAVLSKQHGGFTTWRRVLRLAGAHVRSEALVRTLHEQLQHAQLKPTSEHWRTLELDAQWELVSTQPRRAPLPQTLPSAVDPSVEGLTRALTRLRDKLISGDGRSPSVRVRGPRGGRVFDLASLEQARVGQAERALSAVQAGSRAVLLDAQLSGGHAEGERLGRELLLLAREHTARLEETGAHELAVGAPFLSGYAGDYFVRGPLVLYPVHLVSDGRGARSFVLQPVEDRPPVANQALLRQVFGKRGFAYPDELAEQLDQLAADPAAGHPQLLHALQRVGLATRQLAGALTPLGEGAAAAEALAPGELELEECAALGFFPQSSSDLLQDYDQLLAELARGERPAHELLGAALRVCPPELRSALGASRDAAPADAPTDAVLTPLIAADPSQLEVLHAARTAPALVVDGPPGTGKSQVIVNLVADAIARGLRVAVVSEKRAALDVVAARLTDAGLGDACALVHDVETDRKPLYHAIAERLEAGARPTGSLDALQAAHAEVLARSQSLQARSRWLEAEVEPHGPSRGQLHALESGLLAERLTGSLDLRGVSCQRLHEARPQLSRLGVHLDLLEADSMWAAPRPSMARWSDADFQRFGQDLAHAAHTARALHAAQQGAPELPLPALLAAEPALRAADLFVQHAHEPRAAQWAALLLAKGPAALEADLGELRRAWHSQRELLQRFAERLFVELSEGDRRALEVGRRWAGSLWRFFAPAWWSSKGPLHALLDRLGVHGPANRTTVQEADARWRVSQAWQALEQAFVRLAPRHLLPLRSDALATLLDALGHTAERVRALSAEQSTLQALQLWPQLPPAGSPQLVEHGARALQQWMPQVPARRALAHAARAQRQAAEAIVRCLPRLGLDLDPARAEQVREHLARVAPALRELDGWVDALRPSLPQVDQILPLLAAHREPARWADALSAAWAHTRRIELEQAFPPHPIDAPLAEGSELDAARALERAEDAWIARGADRARWRLDQAALRGVPEADKGARRSDAQKVREGMLKECRKQRRLMPLRTFTRSYANQGLLELLPVWFLSPETLTMLFERAPVFDLIILDEASQVTVEAGLPVLLRAKRFVVAGDDRQMPPSSFFVAKPDEEQSEPTEARDDAEAAPAERDAFAAESLLTLARARCEHRGLRWHYRCVDEDLIAFSNFAMYGASLRTIPGAQLATARPSMRWEAVAGTFEDGKNLAEADRVVDVVGELLARRDKPSIGVVTFNLPQRQLVLDRIDARRAADAQFAATYDAACRAERLDARPFVKNLENVQGDERDVIVFSPAYAASLRTLKNGEQRMRVAARFGPLGLRGGERRLNVAISRAKRETVVVCSFDPELLTVSSSRHAGPRLFKEYLQFARHVAQSEREPARAVLQRVLDTERSAPEPARKTPQLAGYVTTARQVGLALAERGVEWELDVGQSSFRVPLALRDPHDSTRFKLAVLIDEGLEPEVGPSERWVHRARVLRGRGWQVEFVHAREWLLQREAVLWRLERALGTGTA